MTSEDRRFWQAVAEQFGHRPKLDELAFWPSPEPLTAVVLSAPRAVVATVRIDDGGKARIVDASCRMFELGDRSAAAAKALSRDADRFFDRRNIGHVYVRTGAMTGRYPPHALSLKMETIFQLLPGLRVTFVNTQRVAGWIRRERPELPVLPWTEPNARWAALQESAVETAIFAAWNSASEELFTDGSDADG